MQGGGEGLFPLEVEGVIGKVGLVQLVRRCRGSGRRWSGTERRFLPIFLPPCLCFSHPHLKWASQARGQVGLRDLREAWMRASWPDLHWANYQDSLYPFIPHSTQGAEGNNKDGDS